MKTRKQRTKELLEMLGRGPTFVTMTTEQEEITRLWLATHIIPAVQALIPEAREFTMQYATSVVQTPKRRTNHDTNINRHDETALTHV